MSLTTDEFMELFSNGRRREIMAILLEGEVSAGELGDRIGLSQSATSQHLAKMRAAGVVNTRRDAQMIYYSSDFAPAGKLLNFLAGIEVNHG